jgi:hypothetical protein
MAIAAVLLCLAVAPLGPVSKQNTTADRLTALSRTLGIDFEKREDSEAVHPSHEEMAAMSRAKLSAFLDGEVGRGDDSFPEPPEALTEYLQDHHEAIWEIIAALEKQPPVWGDEGVPASPSEISATVRRMLPTIFLARVLIATAFCEEREGRELEADRALEATWSLGRGADGSVIWELGSVAISRWEAGFLRKKKTPSLVWMGRLATEDPYAGMIEALGQDRWKDPSGLSSEFEKGLSKAKRNIVEAVRRMSPCDLAAKSEEEFASLAGDEPGFAAPNIFGVLRRAGRLAVDRELTLQILRLRLARSASKENRWPEELADRWSDVCPGVAYSYSTDGKRMEIRFDSGVEPGSEHFLPLSFEATGGREAKPQPTSTPAVTPTPTPEAP